MTVPYTFRFSYNFFPVGQGLFSAGLLGWEHQQTPGFVWVYDCGTVSDRQLVTASIHQLKSSLGDRACIDLLVLSHFDNDHISGVVELLRAFKVKALLLPYMPLEKRLAAAFMPGQSMVNTDSLEFYIDPVQFLLQRSELGIDNFWFLLPGKTNGRGEIAVNPANRMNPDAALTLNYGRITDDPDEAALLRRSLSNVNNNSQVRFFENGSRFWVTDNLWEFVAYNDESVGPVDASLSSRVNALRDELLQQRSAEQLRGHMRELKQLYRERFGQRNQNIISLFLYAGPVYGRWDASALTRGVQGAPLGPQLWHCEPFGTNGISATTHLKHPPMSRRSSILYTGDGSLHTQEQLDDLRQCLQPDLLTHVGVVQVMHHGSRKNWHKGVAGTIAPSFSVFSSDPKRGTTYHPHAEVLRDFHQYTPIQVDSTFAFHASGYSHWYPYCERILF